MELAVDQHLRPMSIYVSKHLACKCFLNPLRPPVEGQLGHLDLGEELFVVQLENRRELL
jgi:hypothetical protein